MTDHDHDHDEHDHDHHHHDGPHDYVGAVQGYRAEKDEFFKTIAGSPIPAEERDAFTGLPYYPVNVDLVVRGPDAGSRTRATSRPSFEIPTSDSRLRPARRAGTLTFELGGESRRLTAYELEGAHSGRAGVRAVPRRDERPRDVRRRPLPRPRARRGRHVRDRLQPRVPPVVRLPPKFSCPLTPAENRLPDRIEAGERLAEGERPLSDAQVATPSASAIAARWAGVDPQHAPMIRAPASRNASPASAITAGSAR